MSIDKFKRTLRLILVENIFSNPYYFVHLDCIESKTSFSGSGYEEQYLVK